MGYPYIFVRKMKSVFLEKQGATPKNKVLDFLITCSDLDYSLKEISGYSVAGYSTVKLLIKKLVKDNWVIATRKISKVRLYKLNTENQEVKKFIEFYWEVIEQEIEGKNKDISSDSLRSSSPLGAVAVSARSI